MTAPAEASYSAVSRECAPVMVSVRIEADAAIIFSVLADPRRHVDIDGSGMLRGAVTEAIVTGVGDVFVQKMYYSRHGDYEMSNLVVDFEVNRRIAWVPQRHDIDEPAWGHRWAYELVPDGDGVTIVTEIYDCSRVPAEERADMQDGRIWLEAMTRTLGRLDEICTQLESHAA